MRRLPLPGTDLTPSRVAFGCWPLGGGPWGPIDEAEGIAAVRAALDLGVDFFDTAPLYGHGDADRLLKRALGPRIRDVVLATKVGVRFDAATDHAESDLRPEHVRADCEASLKRLGVDRIDLLQVHWPCEHGTPLSDTLGTLERLRDEGSIRAFGLCNYNAAGLAEALANTPVASLQTPLSFVRRDAEEELLPLCRSRDVAVLAYETLARGLLTGKYTVPPTFPETDMRSHDPRFSGSRFLQIAARARHLSAVAGKLRTSTAAVAVGWALSREGVTHAVVGARSPQQIREIAMATRLADSPGLWPAIDRALG